jgi:hypothetical protein
MKQDTVFHNRKPIGGNKEFQQLTQDDQRVRLFLTCGLIWHTTICFTCPVVLVDVALIID